MAGQELVFLLWLFSNSFSVVVTWSTAVMDGARICEELSGTTDCQTSASCLKKFLSCECVPVELLPFLKDDHAYSTLCLFSVYYTGIGEPECCPYMHHEKRSRDETYNGLFPLLTLPLLPDWSALPEVRKRGHERATNKFGTSEPDRRSIDSDERATSEQLQQYENYRNDIESTVLLLTDIITNGGDSDVWLNSDLSNVQGRTNMLFQSKRGLGSILLHAIYYNDK
ncbi:uncharacterized protein LOC128213070 [Mya arenaria]|uniref:uncharacterized protein LOC128213070 n=1 Tax=Mya arenaria TaxID=6604 RepID=UPI0022E7BE20|nr:uncharacterized protein LOC128213070 [Mya arenaria]